MRKRTSEYAGDERRKRPRRQSFLPQAIGITGGIAIATIAFWFFKEQAEEVVEGDADKFDLALMNAIHRSDHEPVLHAMEAITQLGSHAAISIAAGVTALAMLRKDRKHDALTVVISTGGAMIINTALKNVFQRKRPIEMARRIKLPNSHSFPSGHSLLSAATYPIVTQHMVQNQSAGVQLAAHAVSLVTILSVGFSRVYLGVHFPSDVLGGFAVGFGWLGLTSLSHTIAEGSAGSAARRRRLVADDAF